MSGQVVIPVGCLARLFIWTGRKIFDPNYQERESAKAYARMLSADEKYETEAAQEAERRGMTPQQYKRWRNNEATIAAARRRHMTLERYWQVMGEKWAANEVMNPWTKQWLQECKLQAGDDT